MPTYHLRIDNCWTYLLTDDDRVKDVLWKALRFREKGYHFNKRYRMRLWDGYNDFFKKDTGRFLTGLLPEVRHALKTLGVPKESITVADSRKPFAFKVDQIDDQWLNKHIQPGVKPVDLRDYQVDYVNQSIKHRRGVVLAPTSCHAAGQGILMHDGTVKKVEDVKVGDLLMGADSQPRTVESLHSGRTDMWRIIPRSGKSFTVTGDHLLTLEVTGQRNKDDKKHRINKGGARCDVTVRDYLGWSKYKKHIWKLIKTGVEFSHKTLPLEPYLLGVFMGDGSIFESPGVTTDNVDMIAYLEKVAKDFGLLLKGYLKKEGKICGTYYFSSGTHTGHHGRNIVKELLREIGVWGQKCETKAVPHLYLTADKEQRVALLSGLIDTDGHLNSNSYDYISKSEELAENLVFLARSLGLHASISPCIKSSQNGTEGNYFRVYMSGIIDLITEIKHQKVTKLRTNPLRFAFKVEEAGDGLFYGFTLKEEPHYLLDDFFITHNSGKSNVLVSTLLAVPDDTPTLVLANRKSLIEQNYDEIRKWGFNNVGRFYSDHKETDKSIICATVQSAHLLKNWLPSVRCLFVDEIHEMMSKEPRAVYNACRNASVRVAMSATPYKFDGKDKVHKYEVKGYFGGSFQASNTETGQLTTKDLQNRKILAAAECVFYPVHEPQLPYHVYIDAVTDGIATNAHFHDLTRRLVATLIGRTLIIVERISHGDALHDLIPGSLWVRGQDTLETRKQVIERLKTDPGNVVAIATSGIFNTGINVYSHNLLNCAGGQAEHQIIQRFGRGLRVADDKDVLKYYDWIFTGNDYLEKHSWKRVSILEKEGHEVVVKEEFDL